MGKVIEMMTDSGNLLLVIMGKAATRSPWHRDNATGDNICYQLHLPTEVRAEAKRRRLCDDKPQNIQMAGTLAMWAFVKLGREYDEAAQWQVQCSCQLSQLHDT